MPDRSLEGVGHQLNQCSNNGFFLNLRFDSVRKNLSVPDFLRKYSKLYGTWMTTLMKVKLYENEHKWRNKYANV